MTVTNPGQGGGAGQQYPLPTIGGIVQAGIPNSAITVTGSIALPINTDRYVPFVVAKALTLTEAILEVTAGPAAAGAVQIGLYAANPSTLQPEGPPLVNSQIEVALGFTGDKTQALNVPLPPGIYLSAINLNQAMTIRSLCTSSAWLNPVLGASSLAAGLTVARAFAAFPNPGQAWTTAAYTANPFGHLIAYRWTGGI